MILNNDSSYKLQVRKIYRSSINQETWREVDSIEICFWDNIDYPEFSATFTNKELKEFIKMIRE